MKRSRLITLIVLVSLTLLYLFISTSLLTVHNRKENVCRGPLLKTDWKQMGGFEKYTPDKLRLGCWSTALAQIMYYHRLKPFGRVEYTSRHGYRIDQNLDSTSFDWKYFADKLDTSTSAKCADEMALYNYYAALAVRKDFGTDSYMQKLASAELLEQHFNVNAQRYISWEGMFPYATGKLEEIICEQLDKKHPVFLHFANLKDFGHSVVIDGYCYQSETFKVHLNQGQGGPGDGWYDFNRGILRTDDTKLRVIYTFEPKS